MVPVWCSEIVFLTCELDGPGPHIVWDVTKLPNIIVLCYIIHLKFTYKIWAFSFFLVFTFMGYVLVIEIKKKRKIEYKFIS